MKPITSIRKSARLSSGSNQIPVISTRVISEGNQSTLRHSLRGSGKVWKKTFQGKKFEFAEKLKEKRNYIMYVSGMGHEKEVVETIEQIPQEEPKDKIIEERQIIDNYEYLETKDLKKKNDPRRMSITRHQRLSSPFERTVVKKFASNKTQNKPYSTTTTINKTNYGEENDQNKYNSFTVKQENKTVAPSKLYETYKPVKNNPTYSQTKTTTTKTITTIQNKAPIKTSINQYQSKTLTDKTDLKVSKYTDRRGNAPKYEPKNQPKYEPKNQPKYESKTQSKYESKYESKYQTKNESKYQPKYEPKNQPKYESKYESKYQTKNESKYQPKYESKYQSKYESKNISKSKYTRPETEPNEGRELGNTKIETTQDGDYLIKVTTTRTQVSKYNDRRQEGYESKYGQKAEYKPRGGSVPRAGERPRGLDEDKQSDKPRSSSNPRERPEFGGPHGPHGPHGPYGEHRPEFGGPNGPHGPYGGHRPGEKPEDKEDRPSSRGKAESLEKTEEYTGKPGFGPHGPGFGPRFEPHGPGFEHHGPHGPRPGFGPHGPGFGPHGPGFGPHGPGFGPHGPGFEHHGPGFEPHGPHGPGFEPHGPHGPGFAPHGPGFDHHRPHGPGFGPHGLGFGPHGSGFGPHGPGFGPHGPGFGQGFQHLPNCPLYPANLEKERMRFISQQKGMRSFEENTFSQSSNRPFIEKNYGRSGSQPKSGKRPNLTLNTESNASNIGGVTQIRIQQTTGSSEDGGDNYNYYESKNIIKKGRRIPMTIHQKRDEMSAYSEDIPSKYNINSSYSNGKYANQSINVNNTYSQSMTNLNRQMQGLGPTAGKGGSQYTQQTTYKQIKTTTSSGSGGRKAAGAGEGFGTSSYSEYKKYEQKGKVGNGIGSSSNYINQYTDYKRGGASASGYQFNQSNQYMQGSGYDAQYQYNNLGDFSQYQYLDDSEYEIIYCPVHGRQTVRKNRNYYY